MKTRSRLARIFALIFLAAVCSLMLPTAGATAAEKLYKLGLVQGYAAGGSVNFAEGDSLTRAQSITLVVRFLGAEKAATGGSFETPFTDLPDWAKPYIGYAYANGITKGVGDSKFAADAKITDYAFLTSVLRVLGYEDSKGDFAWNAPYALAKSVGLIETETPDGDFTRGDAFEICFAALTARAKNGERLVDRLCKSGVLSKENVDAVLTQAGGGLLLGDIPIEDCKIVVAASAGATEKLMAQTLAEAIGKLYGKTPRILTDEAPQGRGEITVGQTSRAISAEAKNLKQDEAGVFIEGDSLCICAQSTTWLRRATNWFIENHLTEKRQKRLTASDSECGQILENPIFSAIPAGDPHILYDGETGYYYAVYSAPKNDRVTLYRAKTIAELGKAQGKDVYVAGADKEIKHKLFAPELHKVDGKWYIYASGATSTEDKNETPSRSVRLFCLEAIGDDPFGEYVFKAFLNNDILAIDAHVFTYKGENYVSAARILSGVGNTIMLAKLEDPWTVDTARVAVISTPVLGYETLSGRINEGPFALEHDGKLFILYSCNGGSNYSLGLLELTGDDLLNKTSWTKHDKAVFTGTASVISPGHCSVFLSPDGSQYWLAYHTSNKAVGRAISIKRFTFDENGQPVLGQPTLGESFFGPRG